MLDQVGACDANKPFLIINFVTNLEFIFFSVKFLLIARRIFSSIIYIARKWIVKFNYALIKTKFQQVKNLQRKKKNEMMNNFIFYLYII